MTPKLHMQQCLEQFRHHTDIKHISFQKEVRQFPVFDSFFQHAWHVIKLKIVCPPPKKNYILILISGEAYMKTLSHFMNEWESHFGFEELELSSLYNTTVSYLRETITLSR